MLTALHRTKRRRVRYYVIRKMASSLRIFARTSNDTTAAVQSEDRVLVAKHFIFIDVGETTRRICDMCASITINVIKS